MFEHIVIPWIFKYISRSFHSRLLFEVLSKIVIYSYIYHTCFSSLLFLCIAWSQKILGSVRVTLFREFEMFTYRNSWCTARSLARSPRWPTNFLTSAQLFIHCEANNINKRRTAINAYLNWHVTTARCPIVHSISLCRCPIMHATYFGRENNGDSHLGESFDATRIRRVILHSINHSRIALARHSSRTIFHRPSRYSHALLCPIINSLLTLPAKNAERKHFDAKWRKTNRDLSMTSREKMP